MSTATGHRYIVRDRQILDGEPVVMRTRIPVRAVVELWHSGVAPEKITAYLPELTLAQVFDALSYYSDHPQEIALYMDRTGRAPYQPPATIVTPSAMSM